MIYAEYKNAISAACLWYFLSVAVNMNTNAKGEQNLFILSTELKMTYSRSVQYFSYGLSVCDVDRT